MPFVSRPAALVLLSCCLAFGVLLGFTGFLAKDSRPTEAADANAGLRGFNQEDETRRTLIDDESFKLDFDPSKQQESLASVMWPELEGETGGLWGPDDEERLVLQLDNKNFDALDVQAGLWGADFDGREGLAEALLNGNWDRLMEIDDDESFSFSFEL